MRDRATGRTIAWTVAGLTLLAVLLRALAIGQSVWGDELFLYEIVQERGIRDALSVVRETESTPPLYFVLAWIAARIGEHDFLWIRIPSLLFSVATVPLVYALGARTVGHTAALIAAALFAIGPFDIFYGTEGRGYAAVAFFCAASTLSLLELVRTGRRQWAVALAVTTAAAAYTHYVVAFVLAAQFVWALAVHREHARAVLGAYLGAALLYLPWLPGALQQFEDNTSSRVAALRGPAAMAEGVAKLWFGHPFAGLAEVPGRLAVAAIAAGLLAAAVLGVRAAHERGTGPSRGTVLVVLLAAATPVGALLYQLTDSSIFLPRYLSPSVPAGALAIGALLVAPRRPLAVGAATLAVLGGVAAGTVRALGPDGRRPAYRAIAAHLDRVAPAAAPVVELSLFTGPPSRHLGYLFEQPHAFFADRRSLLPAYALGHLTGRFHIVGAPSGVRAFADLLAMEQHGFRLVGRRAWPGVVPLVLLTYASVRPGDVRS